MAMPRPRRSVPLPRLESLAPVHPGGEAIEHRLDGGILHGSAGRLRAAFAQNVVAAERDRIEPKRPRHHVGVALVGPHQLRNAEAAQRAGRRQVGVERIGIDLHVLDVVGTGRGEARLLGDARPDIRIGAAVPPHLARPRRDAAVLDPALDAERAGMLGQGIELLLHGERDLHRPPHQERERRHQGFELDVELGPEAAAQIRHLDPHPVLRPAQQPRDLDAHEGRRLRGGVDGEPAVVDAAARLGDRHERLERQVQHLLGAEGVLEHVIGLREAGLDVAAPQMEIERHIGVRAGPADA